MIHHPNPLSQTPTQHNLQRSIPWASTPHLPVQALLLLLQADSSRRGVPKLGTIAVTMTSQTVMGPTVMAAPAKAAAVAIQVPAAVIVTVVKWALPRVLEGRLVVVVVNNCSQHRLWEIQSQQRSQEAVA
jgi:hypothetical protein